MKKIIIFSVSMFIAFASFAGDDKSKSELAPPCFATVQTTISVTVYCPQQHKMLTTTQNVSGTGFSRESCALAYVAAQADLNTNVQTATKTIQDAAPQACAQP